MVGDYYLQFYEEMCSYSTEYLGQFFFKFGYSVSYKVRLHSEYVGLLKKSWKECAQEKYTYFVFCRYYSLENNKLRLLFIGVY